MADDGCYHIMEQYSAFVDQLTPSHMHAEGRAGLEVTYQRKVEGILGDDNSFKIVFVSCGTATKLWLREEHDKTRGTLVRIRPPVYCSLE